LFGHDLFAKPLHTFPDHAVVSEVGDGSGRHTGGEGRTCHLSEGQEPRKLAEWLAPADAAQKNPDRDAKPPLR
jgi:hypothetical protein